jgi:hypothetical protein
MRYLNMKTSHMSVFAILFVVALCVPAGAAASTASATAPTAPAKSPDPKLAKYMALTNQQSALVATIASDTKKLASCRADENAKMQQATAIMQSATSTPADFTQAGQLLAQAGADVTIIKNLQIGMQAAQNSLNAVTQQIAALNYHP